MLLYHSSPRKQTHQKLDRDSSRFFWFEGVVQFRILSPPLCYDPANASFIAWTLWPKSKSILCRKPSWVQKQTHTHTHTHTQSLSQMSINQQMRKGDSQVRRADLTDNIFQTLAQKPSILGRAQILVTGSSQGKFQLYCSTAV